MNVNPSSPGPLDGYFSVTFTAIGKDVTELK